MNTPVWIGGRSSLVIVPVAVPSAIIAPPVGAESETVKVSFGSNARSPATWRVIVALSCPGAKLTVPVKAELAKSSAPAVPKATVHVAETAPVLPPSRVTVKVIALAPASPSATDESPIERLPGLPGSIPSLATRMSSTPMKLSEPSASVVITRIWSWAWPLAAGGRTTLRLVSPPVLALAT
jgi:hypothetical protein